MPFQLEPTAFMSLLFYCQITAFWKQLAWPDEQSGLAFVCHVLKVTRMSNLCNTYRIPTSQDRAHSFEGFAAD